jgi:transposase
LERQFKRARFGWTLFQWRSAAHRLARRANALVLLDSGWSCEKVAGALLLDDDTIRRWHGLFIEDGLEGLTRFEAGGSACQMNGEQQDGRSVRRSWKRGKKDLDRFERKNCL